MEPLRRRGSETKGATVAPLPCTSSPHALLGSESIRSARAAIEAAHFE